MRFRIIFQRSPSGDFHTSPILNCVRKGNSRFSLSVSGVFPLPFGGAGAWVLGKEVGLEREIAAPNLLTGGILSAAGWAVLALLATYAAV